MCFVSQVMDTWKPYIPDPVTIPWTNPATPEPFDFDRLERLLKSFTKAVEAAKAFDELTGQPDCVDPEKAKLIDRVKELETLLLQENKQKRPKVRVTLSTFDSAKSYERPIYRTVREHVKLKNFKPITSDEYRPTGMTPLNDAVFEFVEHVRSHASESEVQVGLLLDESGSMHLSRDSVIKAVNEYVSSLRDVKKIDRKVAGKGFLVISTDGHENSSTQHTAGDVAKLLEGCEKDGWVVVYLGAGIDGWATGARIGVHGQSAFLQAVSTSNTPAGHSSALRSMHAHSASYLTDSKSYAQTVASLSSRSVTKDGDEVLHNINS